MKIKQKNCKQTNHKQDLLCMLCCLMHTCLPVQAYAAVCVENSWCLKLFVLATQIEPCFPDKGDNFLFLTSGLVCTAAGGQPGNGQVPERRYGVGRED